MAYKFQRGSAILSGALLQEGDVEIESGFSLKIGNAEMSEADLEKLDGITDGTAAASKALVLDTNRDVSGVHAFTLSGSSNGQQQSKVIFGDSENSKLERVHDSGDELLRLISSDAGIDISGSNALGVSIYGGDGPDGGLTVHGANGLAVVNAAGNAAAVDLAQDGSISGSGMLEIGGDVRLDGVADTALNVGADSFYFFDADNSQMKRDSMADYANAIAGEGLAASSGVLAVGVDDTGIEINSDALRLKDSGVVTAKIADDAVTPAKMSLFDDSLAATDTHILIADGTDYSSFAMSGDATLSNAGVLTIAADAVESGMLNDNVISGQTALGSAAVAQADELLLSDDGTLKKVTFSNLEDSVFANVSGQAAVAAGGALSLDVSAITAQTEMTGDVADADELMISDGGVLKRLDFSVLRDAVFADVSGDATVAAGGALTIAADAVEPSMINIFDDSLAATDTHILIADGTDYSSFALSGDVTMTNAGVVTIAADAVESGMLNDNVISGQDDIGADLALTDELLVSDGGTLRRTDLSRFAAMLAGAGLTADSGQLKVSGNDVHIKTDTDILQEGYNYFADISTGSVGVDLPASPTVGDVVHAKAGNITGDYVIRLSAQGSHLIDGEATIDLESPFAAVSLVYVATNAWRIV